MELHPKTPEWHRLRERALGDLFFFASVVLGYSELFPYEADTHLLATRFIERRTGAPEIDLVPFQLILWPRETGKSSICTVARSIQRICADPNVAILIANEKALRAEAFLATIKGHFEKNDFLRALFPEIVPANLNETTWSASRITVNRDTKRPEPTIDTIGVGGTVTGAHYDLIVCDDLISREAMENARAGVWTIMEQTNRWVHQLEPLLSASGKPFPQITFIGCIAEGSRVLMEDGTWRPIQEIKVNESVWSWDAESASFKAQRVTGVWPQGEAATVRVRTGHNRVSLQATPNHPLLTSAPSVHWHRADWFKPYSPIQMVSEIPGTPSGKSYEECWLAGFLLGDGWVTKYMGKNRKGNRTSYSVSVAQSAYPELNANILRVMKAHLGSAVYETATRCYRIDNNVAGKRAEELGIKVGVRAPDKRLPRWIWSALAEEKRAYLQGLCNADGCRISSKVETHRLSTASGNLAEDVKLLALTCGVRPTAIHQRTRVIQAPNSPAPISSTEYSIGLRFETRRGPLRKWRVMSVEQAGKVPVWDLSIEGTENFVCEGFIVHNTRWWHQDTYDHIEGAFSRQQPPLKVLLRSTLPDGRKVSREVERRGDLAIMRIAAVEHGKPIFPKIWGEDRLQRTREIDPELYACNLQNEPTNAAVRIFQDAWLRYWQWTQPGRDLVYTADDGSRRFVGLAALPRVMVVDPAFTTTKDADRSAIVVVGLDHEAHKWIVLDAKALKVEPRDLVLETLNTAKRWDVSRCFVEVVAAQASLIAHLKSEALTRNQALAIEEVRPQNRAKDVRIEALTPAFKAGQMLVHSSQVELLEEYRRFRPGARQRDVLDALAYAVEKTPMLARGAYGAPEERSRMQLATYWSRREGRPLPPKPPAGVF